jgi:hypothetical protein
MNKKSLIVKESRLTHSLLAICGIGLFGASVYAISSPEK